MVTLILYMISLVEIIRVCVELAMMCVLDVASQATESRITHRLGSRVCLIIFTL